MRHPHPMPSRLPAHMHMHMRRASHALLSASAGNQPVRRKQVAHPLRVVGEFVLRPSECRPERPELGLLLATAAAATESSTAPVAAAALAAAAALTTTAVTTAAVYRHG